MLKTTKLPSLKWNFQTMYLYVILWDWSSFAVPCLCLSIKPTQKIAIKAGPKRRTLTQVEQTQIHATQKVISPPYNIKRVLKIFMFMSKPVLISINVIKYRKNTSPPVDTLEHSPINAGYITEFCEYSQRAHFILYTAAPCSVCVCVWFSPALSQTHRPAAL